MGLLFDHGCDALTVFLQGMSLATVLQLGNSGISFVVFIVGFLTFFYATLEEYFTHVLSLPCINGAEEGNVIISAVFIFTYFAGTEFWLADSLMGFKRNELMLLGLGSTSIPMIFIKFHKRI